MADMRHSVLLFDSDIISMGSFETNRAYGIHEVALGNRLNHHQNRHPNDISAEVVVLMVVVMVLHVALFTEGIVIYQPKP